MQVVLIIICNIIIIFYWSSSFFIKANMLRIRSHSHLTFYEKISRSTASYTFRGPRIPNFSPACGNKSYDIIIIIIITLPSCNARSLKTWLSIPHTPREPWRRAGASHHLFAFKMYSKMAKIQLHPPYEWIWVPVGLHVHKTARQREIDR